MFWVFELTAMALDTLPTIGRGMILAVLLSIALYGVSRGIRNHPSQVMQLYYRKAAILVLVLVPVLVSLFGLEMPVYVEQAQQFHTPIPALVSYGLALVWAAGFLWGLLRLGRSYKSTQQAIAPLSSVSETSDIDKRAQHWQVRLALQPGPEIRVGGSQGGWQGAGVVVLPNAVRHWPVGQLDTLLLLQLAAYQQRCWLWLLSARLVSALYWPLPWVKSLFGEFDHALVANTASLARAAYRDPEGWRRDLRKLRDRYETLEPVPTAGTLALAVYPPAAEAGEMQPVPPALAPVGIESRNHAEAAVGDPLVAWAATRERREARNFDPYERVYWLVAIASVVVSVGTTLTIKQASPEFEPGFLNIRWHDQMGRRLTDKPAQPGQPRPAQNSTD